MLQIPSWLISLIVSVGGAAITVSIQLVRGKIMLEMLNRTVQKLHERVDDLQNVQQKLGKEIALIQQKDELMEDPPPVRRRRNTKVGVE